MEVMVLLQVLSLVDIGSFTYDGSYYMVVIEKAVDNGQSTETRFGIDTKWHIWKLDKESNELKKHAELSTPMPAPMAAGLAACGGNLYALVENNGKLPAPLLQWPIETEPVFNFASGPEQVSVLYLDSARIRKVEIDPRSLWSTVDLSPQAWVFNPCLAMSSGCNDFKAVINTAVGDAVLMGTTSLDSAWAEKAFYKDALEPVYLQMGSKAFLAYRQTGEKWSMMFRTPRYSAMMPPVTLPLVLAELDRSGQISKKRELSKEAAFGEVFSFAFAGSDEKNLGLAIVRETIEEPVLVILVSNDSGETWQRKGTYMLKQLPVRMNLLLTEKQAYAGLAFQVEQGFEVTTFKCEL